MQGQISLFLLLGVLVLVVIGMVYLFSSVNESTVVDTSFGREVSTLIDNCLESVAQQGIVTLLKQGGVLLESQGSVIADPLPQNAGVDHIFAGSDIVWVGVLRNEISGGLFSADPPIYPWEFFPYPDSTSPQESFGGFFGRVQLYPLRAQDGPFSWEAQLAEYIEDKLPGCTDYSGVQVQVSSGTPQAAVIIAPGHVTAEVVYPTVVEGQQLQEYEEFSVVLRTPMGRMHEFVSMLLQQEAFDITFDSAGADQGNYQVDVLQGVHGTTDVLQITDVQNAVRGQDIVFKTAVHNRPPALRYLRPQSLSFSSPHQFTAADFGVVEAFDPDDDPITIVFNPPLPHTATGSMTFTVSASDGEYIDEQQLTFTVS